MRFRVPRTSSLNVLCAIGDHSTQSDQPIMKHLKVTVAKSQPEG
jgi:hypothetical protein